MGLPSIAADFTFEQFLRWLEGQTARHEFLAGEVFAMSGGTAEHASAILNLGASMSAALRGSACRVFVSDMMVRIEAADAAYFPDVAATCEDLPKGSRFLKAPKLIVEVLSPSTEAFDRGRKFQDYQLLPSLEEYALVDPERGTVEIFRRKGTAWLYEKTAEGTVHFRSLTQSLALEEIFR